MTVFYEEGITIINTLLFNNIKMLLSENVLKRSVEAVLLYSYIVNSTGFSHGKLGISITLFELANQLKDESLENHAFELLREVLAYDMDDYNFMNGMAGKAYALNYLIRNKLLDADYFEIYAKQHKKIIEQIKNTGREKKTDMACLDYYFFIETSDYISRTDYRKCHNKITECVLNALDENENNIIPANIMHLYVYLSKLLSILNNTKQTKSTTHIFDKVNNINNKIIQSDWVCGYPLFPLQFCLYGFTHRQKEIIQKGEIMVKNSIDNLMPSTLNLRQRIDMILALYQLYIFNKKTDYKVAAHKLAQTLTDDNMNVFEQKATGFIYDGKQMNMGLGFGFCRLLMLHIYWDQICRNIIPYNLKEVLLV
jgi:hypothetical protein